MSWRANVVSSINPGLLAGIALGDWVRLLRENRFNIAPNRLLRAFTISLRAARTSAIRLWERRRFGSIYENRDVPPPLFILGHWRNGTTHLHNLLAIDQRFAYPNNYQVFFPHTFLSTEAIGSRIISAFWPKHRPMDNVEWSMRSPQEDEFAVCVSSLVSPCMGWVFPQRREHYDKFLTLRDVSESDVARWRDAFSRFLKKLTWKYERPLVLKSPPHTCRIRLLLEMFPNAKFVHIHRDPYTVFQSSQRMFRMIGEMSLQRLRQHDLDDWILRQHRVMYDAFFEERSLIPDGQYHEMSFEQLESDPIGQMRGLYEALNLPDFVQAEPALTRYVESIADYQKNEFPSLPDELRTRVAEAWRPCFTEWGYPTQRDHSTDPKRAHSIEQCEFADNTN
jgi:hypothetical protein